MILSYDRILSFLDELSQTVIVLFRDSDNKVLPSTSRKGIFTVFVDDNVDKNSSSVDATDHFHGTGASVLQFPTTQNPGQRRCRKKYMELSDLEKGLQSCISLFNLKNVHQVNNKLNAVYPIETVNILTEFQERLDELRLRELEDEDIWL